MMALGFSGYLSKPIDVSKLELILRKNLPSEKITYGASSESTKKDEAVAKKEEETARANCGFEKYVDIVEGTKNCGGPEGFEMILQVVLDNGDSDVEAIKQSFNDEDWQNFVIKAHALKSTCANIGATKLSDRAKTQEAAGKAGDYEYIKNNFEELIRDYQKLLQSIKVYLGNNA